MRQALVSIVTDKVISIIEIADEGSTYEPPDYHILVDPDEDAEVGGTYVDGVFTPPAPTVSVPSIEERFDTFLTRIEAIPNDATSETVRDEVRQAAIDIKITEP
jgi:hypothetical protein